MTGWETPHILRARTAREWVADFLAVFALGVLLGLFWWFG